MTMFFLQTLFFVAVAFGLGCLCGCWLKGRFGAPRHRSGAAGAITREGAARTSTAGELASSTPHYEPGTTPQPAAALTPEPEPEPEPETKPAQVTKPREVVDSAPEAPVATPGKRPSKPKTVKAAKSAASKPRTAKSSETKAAAAKPKPAKAKPKAATVADNLKQIKGVGPQIEAKLNAAGINSFAQIAAWTKKEQADFAEQLSFAGRIEREDWVNQAKILAKGGSTEFAKRVAKGEVASSSAGKPGRGGKK